MHRIVGSRRVPIDGQGDWKTRDGEDRRGFRGVPDRHAHQQAMETSQVAPGIPRHAENDPRARTAPRNGFSRPHPKSRGHRAVPGAPSNISRPTPGTRTNSTGLRGWRSTSASAEVGRTSASGTRRKFEVRRASDDDRPFLEDVFLRAGRDMITAARGAWDEERERQQFRKQLEIPFTWVVRHQSRDVGFMMVVVNEAAFELHTPCIQGSLQARGRWRRSLRAGERRRPVFAREDPSLSE